MSVRFKEAEAAVTLAVPVSDIVEAGSAIAGVAKPAATSSTPPEATFSTPTPFCPTVKAPVVMGPAAVLNLPVDEMLSVPLVPLSIPSTTEGEGFVARMSVVTLATPIGEDTPGLAVLPTNAKSWKLEFGFVSWSQFAGVVQLGQGHCHLSTRCFGRSIRIAQSMNASAARH